MKKTINMGYCKIAGEQRRRKAIVDVKLEVRDGKLYLSIVGEINGYSSGQCCKEMEKYAVQKRQNFDEIIEIWKRYHLNDMRAGTPKQERAVREYCKNNEYDYNKVREYLDSVGLLVDNGYTYGTSWLYEEIPQDVLNKIFKW